MKIAIIGAAGKAGRLIAAEAINRGHDVTGFGRSPREGVDVVKDVFEITADDLASFDVVIDALGFFTPEMLEQHTTSLNHLADLLSGSQTRLLVVGGAGSLYLDPQHTSQLLDAPDFPEVFVPLAKAQAIQLESLRARGDVRWTYVSPAVQFDADGERTGDYVLSGERLEVNAEGQSQVSYADYAIAMLDEVEAGEHIGQRISVRSR